MKPIDPQYFLRVIWESAPLYAQAKADRVYCEGAEVKRVQVKGWPEYEVDDLGGVYRVKPAMGATVGKPLKPQRMKNGYEKVSLCRDAKRKEVLVHRLVYESFVDDIPAGMEICHNDGKRSNNQLSNLRCDTRKGNMLDTIKHGTTNRGERCGSNKYPQELVRELKSRLAAGEKAATLSRQYGIPKSTVYGIGNGQTWGWL